MQPGPLPSPCRFFLKRAPFSIPGGAELNLEHVKPAYQVGGAFSTRKASFG